MTDSTSAPVLQTPGDVDIQGIFLVNVTGKFVSLDDYMSELNIYEDIFSNTMSGDIVISDKGNLIGDFPIIGDELIIINFKTPGYPNELGISKTFRLIAVTNRKANPLLYVLRFCSVETIINSISPIYKSFSGKITDVVKDVFTNYVQTNRGLFLKNNEQFVETNEKTSLTILNETSNRVKFVSPGWGPLKILNWLASKSMPKDSKACNYLFWETNKKFYFGSVEKIFEIGKTNKNLNIGTYYYTPPGVFNTRDLQSKMFVIEELDILKTRDTLESHELGYLANRVLSIDLINKDYNIVDYDHVESFDKYTHVSGKKVMPFFTRPLRNTASKTVVSTKHPYMYNDFSNNVDEKYSEIFGNRQSNMLELNNFKMRIVVPGRTDVEVGSLIEIIYPDFSPISENESSEKNNDKLYSGNYLITSIRHKINPVRHYMIMEVVKDSLIPDKSIPLTSALSEIWT